jgi:cytidine deaminase
MNITGLINEALKVTGKYKPSKECTSGAVGAALLTKDGNIYTGVCIDAACGIGFCAEHSAIAEMLKHRESEISMLVAVNTRKQILPPCGRCRELIYQINRANATTKIILNQTDTITLKELLPLHWLDISK